jgi:hypothetical protein
MKGLIKLLSLAAVMAFFVTSCNKCADVTCGTNSACEEGECICFPSYVQDTTGGSGCVCPTGYEAAAEGDSCNIEWSAKFVGSNLATQDTVYGTSGNFGLNYNMSLSRVDEKTLSTTNLGAFGATNTVDMNVVDPFTLSINDTDVSGRIFTGSGSIAGNTIVIDYIVEYSDGTRDTSQAIVTK